jgi:thiosulfate/3-mercaptopyruvate sulfurtransferase
MAACQRKRTVVDDCTNDRYRGENETIDPVGDHFPCAKNRFSKDNLTSNGRFKDAEQLKAEFVPLFASAREANMQCGSGITACDNLLALEIAGLPGAALYPGSWNEWVKR